MELTCHKSRCILSDMQQHSSIAAFVTLLPHRGMAVIVAVVNAVRSQGLSTARRELREQLLYTGSGTLRNTERGAQNVQFGKRNRAHSEHQRLRAKCRVRSTICAVLTMKHGVCNLVCGV